MTPFQFPSDAAMLAAFESILDQLDTERRRALDIGRGWCVPAPRHQHSGQDRHRARCASERNHTMKWEAVNWNSYTDDPPPIDDDPHDGDPPPENPFY